MSDKSRCNRADLRSPSGLVAALPARGARPRSMAASYAAGLTAGETSTSDLERPTRACGLDCLEALPALPSVMGVAARLHARSSDALSAFPAARVARRCERGARLSRKPAVRTASCCTTACSVAVTGCSPA